MQSGYQIGYHQPRCIAARPGDASGPHYTLMKLFTVRVLALLGLTVFGLLPNDARGEAMLQYFNTDWNEIAAENAGAGRSRL